MDTVTYPQPEVQQFVAAHFEPAQVMYGDQDPEIRESLRRFRMIWAPAFIILDHRNQEIRRWIGFLPPRDFIAELRMGLGKIHLIQQKLQESFEQFRAVADLDPPAPISDEAVYWAGIAIHYRDKTELGFLHDYWKELERRFPDSRWWTAANVF